VRTTHEMYKVSTDASKQVENTRSVRNAMNCRKPHIYETKSSIHHPEESINYTTMTKNIEIDLHSPMVHLNILSNRRDLFVQNATTAPIN